MALKCGDKGFMCFGECLDDDFNRIGYSFGIPCSLSLISESLPVVVSRYQENFFKDGTITVTTSSPLDKYTYTIYNKSYFYYFYGTRQPLGSYFLQLSWIPFGTHIEKIDYYWCVNLK